MGGFRSAGQRGERTVFYDVMDVVGQFPMTDGTGMGTLVRGGDAMNPGNGRFNGAFFSNGAAPLWNAPNGVAVYRMPGAGAGGFSQNATQSGIMFPCAQQRSIAPILPADLYSALHFHLRLTAWRDVGNDGRMTVRLGSSATPMLGAFGSAGFGLEVNGDGNWHAIQRRIRNGTIEQNFDTGLTCTTPRTIEFFFTQGANPRLECKLDGVSVLVAEGDANMQEPSNTNGEGLQLAVSSEGVNAAFFDYFGLARFTVSE